MFFPFDPCLLKKSDRFIFFASVFFFFFWLNSLLWIDLQTSIRLPFGFSSLKLIFNANANGIFLLQCEASSGQTSYTG